MTIGPKEAERRRLREAQAESGKLPHEKETIAVEDVAAKMAAAVDRGAAFSSSASLKPAKRKKRDVPIPADPAPAPKAKFDKVAYQRDLMRRRRAAAAKAKHAGKKRRGRSD